MSQRSPVSSLTSLSDLEGDPEPPSDAGPESEEETTHGSSLTGRSSATLFGGTPDLYESVSASDGKRKRKISAKGVQNEPKKRRKLGKSKTVSSRVPKSVKPKWAHMTSQFALCWVVLSGYNGNCDWPAVILEGGTVTDVSDFHLRVALSISGTNQRCSLFNALGRSSQRSRSICTLISISCTAWYHFGCVGVADENDPRLEAAAEFFCPPCATSMYARVLLIIGQC